jgi:hypothetical protein
MTAIHRYQTSKGACFIARKHWHATPATIALWAGIVGAIVLAGLLASAALAAGPACAVSAGGGADYTTIQAAVDDTNCTHIQIAPGVYREHVVINRNMTVQGSGADTTIVDSGRTNSVFVLGNQSPNSTTVNLSDLTIQNGSVGIFNNGTLTVTNSIVTNNIASGIGNRGTATISNTTIVSNTASSEFGGASGAGIYNSGTLAVDHSEIISNTLFGNGGGVYSGSGSLMLTNSSVRGNTSSGIGGGVFIAGSFDRQSAISNTTISGNRANSGGGLYAQGGSQIGMTLTNVTISGNSAVEGAGIQKGTDPSNAYFTLTIVNATIANNTITSGSGAGGITNSCCGTTFIRNTILSNNSNANCSNSGTLSSYGFNVDSGSTCGFTAAGDQSNTDPKLGPLHDNGGPNQTHALLDSSPAIDAVNTTQCPLTDQRGVARPTDGDGNGTFICDVGAYELSATYRTFLSLLFR